MCCNLQAIPIKQIYLNFDSLNKLDVRSTSLLIKTVLHMNAAEFLSSLG